MSWSDDQETIRRLRDELAKLRNLAYGRCVRCDREGYLKDGMCSHACELGQVRMAFQDVVVPVAAAAELTYSREEFERDRMGQTGEDNARKWWRER